jgi:drug/metabolite transporter (DMT)-like permease
MQMSIVVLSMSLFSLIPASPVLKGVFAMLACVFVTALAGAAIKHISVEVPVTTIVCLQYLICLLLLLPGILRQGTAILKTRQVVTHLVRSLGGWLCFLCYYLAIAHIPLVEAALLRSASPLCVPVVIWFMTRRRITPLLGFTSVLGFLGVGLILRPEAGSINLWHLVGFFSAVFLAISMVLTRKLTFTEPSVRILFYYFLISFLCSLPLMIIGWMSFSLQWVPYILFIGVSIYIALWLYTRAYVYASPSLVSPFSYFGVVFAGFFGWLFWGHLPDLVSFAGIALVIGCGVLTVIIGERK